MIKVSFNPMVYAGLMDIDDVVCSVWGISRIELRKKIRKKEVVEARNVAMWYVLNTRGRTLRQVGEIYGGLSHCTVYWGKNNVTEWAKTDKVFKGMVIKTLKEMRKLEPTRVKILAEKNGWLKSLINEN